MFPAASRRRYDGDVPRRTFVIELASDARFASDLSAGGVFVALTGVTVLDEIDLVVRGQAGELCVLARVVYIDPAAGCGLELAGFGPELKEQLAQLAATPAEVAAVAGTRARRRRVLSRHPRAVKDSIEMIALDEAGGGDDDGGDDGGDDGRLGGGSHGGSAGGPAGRRLPQPRDAVRPVAATAGPTPRTSPARRSRRPARRSPGRGRSPRRSRSSPRCR